MIRKNFSLFFVILFLVTNQIISSDDYSFCGPPPRAKQHRRSASEMFPPLPLPATPLRRTEKKRPPRPLPVIGKIKYDKKTEVWNSARGDLDGLMDFFNTTLKMQYGYKTVILNEFTYDVNETPVLYITGHSDFTFTKDQVGKIRQYLDAGGFLIGDACCGSEIFSKAFKRECEKIYTNIPLRKAPPDHPIYLTYFHLDRVKYNRTIEGNTSGSAQIYTIDIGCRSAVIFHQYNLSCGWNGIQYDRPVVKSIAIDDALKLGVNEILYILEYRKYAKIFEDIKVNNSKNISKNQFTFAQVKHTGDWDPHKGFSNFLESLKEKTKGRYNIGRKTVSLRDRDLFSYPFLYLTGHHAFSLSQSEFKNLKTYLEKGGFLLIDNCCGRQIFDESVQQLMVSLSENSKLSLIEKTHPLYHCFYEIQGVHYTREVVGDDVKSLYQPVLQGLKVNNHYAVVYSRFGLGSGWQNVYIPHSRRIQHQDSINLGVNIVVYALTH